MGEADHREPASSVDYGEPGYRGRIRMEDHSGSEPHLVWWRDFEAPEALALSRLGLVVVDVTGAVTLLDSEEGTTIWSTPVSDSETSGGVEAWASGDVIAVSAPPRSPYQLRVADGAPVDGRPTTPPSADQRYVDDRVKVGADFTALELRDPEGTLVARVSSDPFVDPIPYAIRSGDLVFVGDAAGNVVCLRWPMAPGAKREH